MKLAEERSMVGAVNYCAQISFIKLCTYLESLMGWYLYSFKQRCHLLAPLLGVSD